MIAKVTGEVVSSPEETRPLMLVVVILNVLFLAITAYVLSSAKRSGERRDKLLTDLVASCKPGERT